MSEWAAAGRLTGQGLGTIVDVVAGMHDAIGQRVESSLPPGASHIVGLQRAHAARVYRRVGAAHRRIPTALGQVAPRGATVHDSKAGRAVLPLLNGLWGDHLAHADEPLTIRMWMRGTARQNGLNGWMSSSALWLGALSDAQVAQIFAAVQSIYGPSFLGS